MEYLDQDARVILVDATLDDKPPGTISLLKPKFASDFPKAMSTHEIGLKDLGYAGNKPNRWDGVPQEVLDQYGVKYDEKMLRECVKWDDAG